MDRVRTAFTHHSRSRPCCPHLHAECVSLALQQRSFAAQLHVEVGGVRCEAEILSEVNRQSYHVRHCQNTILVSLPTIYLLQ